MKRSAWLEGENCVRSAVLGSDRLERILHEIEKSRIGAVKAAFRIDQGTTGLAKDSIRGRLAKDLQRLVGQTLHIEEIAEQDPSRHVE